jgi:hypothetical protein
VPGAGEDSPLIGLPGEAFDDLIAIVGIAGSGKTYSAGRGSNGAAVPRRGERSEKMKEQPHASSPIPISPGRPEARATAESVRLKHAFQRWLALYSDHGEGRSYCRRGRHFQLRRRASYSAVCRAPPAIGTGSRSGFGHHSEMSGLWVMSRGPSLRFLALLHCRRLHGTYNGLTTGVDVHVLDGDLLLTLTAIALQGLQLHRKRSQ